MKLASLLSTLLFASVCCGFAQSDVEREFKQLEAQREKDVAAALEPINRRYATALQQLLQRATQAKDLSATTKITNALQALNSAPVEILGKWNFVREGYPPKERELKEDGTVLRPDGPPGKWTIEGSTLRIEYPGGRSSTFQLPPRNRKLTGKGEDGDKVTAEKK
jgi:hypothetical protein